MYRFLGACLPIIVLLIVLYVFKVRDRVTGGPYRPPFFRKRPEYPEDVSIDPSQDLPPWLYPPYYVSGVDEDADAGPPRERD